MFGEAAEVDETEDRLFGDARGDELPAELADARRRGARLDAALRKPETQRQAREAEEAAARAARRQAWQERGGDGDGGSRAAGRPPAELELEAAEAALAREEARAGERARRRAEREGEAAAAGRKPKGRPPKDVEHRDLRRARRWVARARAKAEQAGAEQERGRGGERVNTTDPDSRIMKTANGWVQGYNAQAAVNEDGIVLAADVTQEHNDVGQCQPMMARTRANLDAAGIADAVEVMLFDAGYLSEENLTVEGPDRLIATGKSWKLRRQHPTEGSPPADATPVEAMGHRLRTDDGAALYAKRQHTIEPVFGDVKHLRGFRRFSRRGLTAVDAEWKLQMAAHNILKMFRHRSTPRLA